VDAELLKVDDELRRVGEGVPQQDVVVVSGAHEAACPKSGAPKRKRQLVYDPRKLGPPFVCHEGTCPSSRLHRGGKTEFFDTIEGYDTVGGARVHHCRHVSPGNIDVHSEDADVPARVWHPGDCNHAQLGVLRGDGLLAGKLCWKHDNAAAAAAGLGGGGRGLSEQRLAGAEGAVVRWASVKLLYVIMLAGWEFSWLAWLVIVPLVLVTLHVL
jgi:hypothetical protein